MICIHNSILVNLSTNQYSSSQLLEDNPRMFHVSFSRHCTRKSFLLHTALDPERIFCSITTQPLINITGQFSIFVSFTKATKKANCTLSP